MNELFEKSVQFRENGINKEIMIEIKIAKPPILTIGIVCFFLLLGISTILYFEPNLIMKGTKIVEMNPEKKVIKIYLPNKFKISF